MAPLSGFRVVDLTRLLPGDFATWVLADLGADLIKVEDREAGDYMRHMPPSVGDMNAYFWALNRGKRCITIDLKRPEGIEVFLRLVDSADALVEGFRPGVMDKLGLGYHPLSQRNPTLVYCSISGYGQDGPYRERAGHDLGYNSVAGLIGSTGARDGEPAVPAFQMADLAGGGMAAALAVVSALLERERDPERRGTYLDVSMFDSVAAIISPHLIGSLAGGMEGPAKMPLNGVAPCYRLYRTKDDRWMALTALEPKFWSAFCELVERPDLSGRAFDESAHADVEALFLSRTRVEWVEQTANADVMLEPVNSFAEAMEHPQFKARGLLLDVDGLLPQPAPLVRLPGNPHADTRVAAQGEDTGVVLGELGYSEQEVAALRAGAVI